MLYDYEDNIDIKIRWNWKAEIEKFTSYFNMVMFMCNWDIKDDIKVKIWTIIL